MSERVQAYFEALKRKSSEELDASARNLAVKDKVNDAEIIAILTELRDRDYHKELKYPNLFTYAVERLNLSEGSVFRRTQVARVCRTYPQILESLFSGRIHLTGASLIAPHLEEGDADALLAMAEGKTKRELQKILAASRPKKEFRPSVRKQPAAVVEENAEVPAPRDAKPAEKPHPSPGRPRTWDLLEPATEERYNFRFSAGKGFTEKFQRLAEVLNIGAPHAHIEAVFEKALEIALEKKDPKRKLERRRKREARKQRSPAGDAQKELRHRPGKETRQGNGGFGAEAGGRAVSRYVPSEVQERHFERAGYQCEYRGPDGARCPCRTGLQIEHTRPYAVFKSHDERYLRVYCAAHNLFAAKEYYGRDFIQKKIEERTRSKRKRDEEERLFQGAAVPSPRRMNTKGPPGC
jgi:hypothetical protein